MEFGVPTDSLVRSFAVIAGLGVATGAALGQNYPIDWVTIGDVRNEPYPGDAQGRMAGRGGVGYTYRIGRTEVTTGQWMEFVNTFSTQSDDFTYFADPLFWGARIDPGYDGPGRRYILRDIDSAEQLPVGGISWREAAMFANWLHNDRSSDLSAIEDGAYDTSTFTTNGDNTFNDQWTHHPDARFWIPTLDEWLKAVHYDPDRNGQGDGGWWDYPITSDEPPIYGIPGEGQANSGFELPRWGEWDIPLGAYADVRSPWGLLDAAGAAMEWLEEVSNPDIPKERQLDGSPAGWPEYMAEHSDRISRFGGSLAPNGAPSTAGLRIAAIPSPAPLGLALWGLAAWHIRSRRRRPWGTG